MPCSECAWLAFKRLNSITRIHLIASASSIDCMSLELLIQPSCPVYSVTCCNVCLKQLYCFIHFFFCFNGLIFAFQLRFSHLRKIMENYHESIVKVTEKTSKAFDNYDDDLVQMAMACDRLNLLVIIQCKNKKTKFKTTKKCD